VVSDLKAEAKERLPKKPNVKKPKEKKRDETNQGSLF
jgi:hypothetical protein